MAKFLISKEERKDCSHDDLDKDENGSNSDDSLPVEITIKKTIINRNIIWKWYNFERYKGKGTRKPKFTTEEKKFLCEKVEGKVAGKDEASSLALQKEFYEKFKK